MCYASYPIPEILPHDVSVLAILLLSGIILLPVLLPVSVTDNTDKPKSESNSNGTFTNLDKLAMGNITVSPMNFSLIICHVGLFLY